MQHAPVTALGFLIAALTTSCGLSAMQTPSRPVQPMDVKDRQPPRPQIKHNPNPTAYEVTMTIENAPGPFGSIEGLMQYETALNDPCLPDLGGMAGTRMRLKEHVPVTLEQVGENTYRGIYYTDLLVDEDYFGLGVCRWSMIAARVVLRAGMDEGDASFFENIFFDDLVSRERVKVYFWKGRYPGGQIEGMNVPGEEVLEKFKPEARHELFALSFDIRRIEP